MDYVELAEKCKGLAHPVRLEILDMLRGGEICVCHIERALGRRQSYVSQQLSVLRDSGLVDAHKDGLQVFYRLADSRLSGWLEALFETSATRSPRLEGCPCPLCSTIPVEDVVVR